MPFGESIWFKRLRDQKRRGGKFDSEWREGIWLGHARSSDEHLIGTDAGVVRAWTVRRKPEEERWQGMAIKALRGSPQQPDPARPGMRIPIEVEFDPEEEFQEDRVEPCAEDAARQLQIRRWMLEKFGETPGCRGCEHLLSHKDKRPHTQECRRRIKDALAGDEEGRRVLRREEARRKQQRSQDRDPEGTRRSVDASGEPT